MLPRLGRGLQTAMLRAAFALWVPWQGLIWEEGLATTVGSRSSKSGDVPILWEICLALLIMIHGAVFTHSHAVGASMSAVGVLKLNESLCRST